MASSSSVAHTAGCQQLDNSRSGRTVEITSDDGRQIIPVLRFNRGGCQPVNLCQEQGSLRQSDVVTFWIVKEMGCCKHNRRQCRMIERNQATDEPNVVSVEDRDAGDVVLHLAHTVECKLVPFEENHTTILLVPSSFLCHMPVAALRKEGYVGGVKIVWVLHLNLLKTDHIWTKVIYLAPDPFPSIIPLESIVRAVSVEVRVALEQILSKNIIAEYSQVEAIHLASHHILTEG